MSNDRQFQLKTKIVATRGVKDYRATIPMIVRPADVVLEIGCEWGVSTRVLAEYTETVLGTDVSPECISRAREMHPDLRFAVLDAFDLRAVGELQLPPTVVYIDMSGLSGYRSTLDVLSLVNSYSSLLRPRTIVVKSGALVNLAARLQVGARAAASPDKQPLEPAQ